jgi:hypothetical protein
LPATTHDKVVAVSRPLFAARNRLTTKRPNPVVYTYTFVLALFMQGVTLKY